MDFPPVTSTNDHTIGRLRKRPDFLAASKGRRFHTAAFGMQARTSAAPLHPEPRVGFTVTRKVGNSVERNRIRRRLREAVKSVPHTSWHTDFDYVLVAKREVLSAPFASLIDAMGLALHHIHKTDGRSAKR